MVELCFTGVAVDAFNFGAVYSGHFAVNLNLRACVKIILRLANLWASRLYAGNVGKHTYITVATFRTAPLFLCWRKRIVHTRVAQTWSFSSIPRVWLKLEPVSLPPSLPRPLLSPPSPPCLVLSPLPSLTRYLSTARS